MAQTTLTVAQAALITHHNERAVRWRIAQGHLASVTGDDGHMRVDLADLERIPGWHVDAARLDELQRQDTGPSGMVATLEERIRALEERVRALEGRQVAVPSWDGSSHSHYAASDPDAPVSASFVPLPPRRAVPTMRLSSGLPGDLVSMAAFAVRHNIAETTAKKAAQTGRLPARQGHWKQGRAYVSWALDADGRRQFYALWGGRDNFTRCPACPHALDTASATVLADTPEGGS